MPAFLKKCKYRLRYFIGSLYLFSLSGINVALLKHQSKDAHY